MAVLDHQTFAQALYESLIGTALQQLKAATPKVSQLTAGDPDIQAKLSKALPKDTLPQVTNFLLVLARENALEMLPGIVTAFERYEATTARALDADVTSAVALSEQQQQRIMSDLRQRYRAELEVRFHVDESLIGGLVIRVGDQVLDNSLRSRLGAVQRSMRAS